MYIEQSQRFEIKGKEQHVYKLQNELYGFKQAPRAWYSRINKNFVDHGFERSEREPTLYAKRCTNRDFIMVCLYVDDMIFAGTSKALIDEFKIQMMKEFEMTDLNFLKYFLGLEIK